jgi:hypothetical protein
VETGLDLGSMPVRLAAIFASLGAKAAGQIYDEFVFGNIGSNYSAFVSRNLFIELITAIDELSAHNPSTLPAHKFEKYYMTEAADHIFQTAELMRSIPIDLINAARQRRADIYDRLDVAPGENIPPLLTGEEIMMTAKIKSGPKVGELANRLRDEQLEGRITDKNAAAEFILTFS